MRWFVLLKSSKGSGAEVIRSNGYLFLTVSVHGLKVLSCLLFLLSSDISSLWLGKREKRSSRVLSAFLRNTWVERTHWEKRLCFYIVRFCKLLKGQNTNRRGARTQWTDGPNDSGLELLHWCNVFGLCNVFFVPYIFMLLINMFSVLFIVSWRSDARVVEQLLWLWFLMRYRYLEFFVTSWKLNLWSEHCSESDKTDI